jgi:acetoin utilization protein AcuB
MVREIVGRYMTPSPITVGARQTLSAAHRLMCQNGIRHLPVLDGGRLVGVLSIRDLHWLESLPNVDPNLVAVEEAMTPDPMTVSPGSALEKVATQMAEHRYGSAVVVDKGKVVGVFTTIDALHALVGLLRKEKEA